MEKTMRQPLVPDGFVRIADLRNRLDKLLDELDRTALRVANERFGLGEIDMCQVFQTAAEEHVCASFQSNRQLLEWVPGNEDWFKIDWSDMGCHYEGDIYLLIESAANRKCRAKLDEHRAIIEKCLLLEALEGFNLYAVDQWSAARIMTLDCKRHSQSIHAVWEMLFSSVYWRFLDDFGGHCARRAMAHCKKSVYHHGEVPPTPCTLSIGDAWRIGETDYRTVFDSYWAGMLDE